MFYGSSLLYRGFGLQRWIVICSDHTQLPFVCFDRYQIKLWGIIVFVDLLSLKLLILIVVFKVVNNTLQNSRTAPDQHFPEEHAPDPFTKSVTPHK